MVSHEPARSAATCLHNLVDGDVVLVAGADANRTHELMDALADCGHAVVGPARRAASALLLAGHAPVTRAVVYDELSGERNGRQLAAALASHYGISTLLIDHGGEDGDDRCMG